VAAAFDFFVGVIVAAIVMRHCSKKSSWVLNKKHHIIVVSF
jgi:hypothetical protein